MTETVLRVWDLEVSYRGRVAVTGADLTVGAGMSVAVVGPNGSGKSTLLAAIAGLVELADGGVDVDRRSLAFVLQSTEVDRSLPITVTETVRMARYPHRGMFGRLRRDDHAAIAAAMGRTRVDDLANRQLHELSGGQRQRVLVAQGLAQEARLLLLDEPLTGLDLVSRQVILDVVDEERAAGRAVVMTTHSLDEAASCDRVVLLATRMIAAGAPDEVLTEANLRSAFGRVLRLESGEVLVDDPHHPVHE